VNSLKDLVLFKQFIVEVPRLLRKHHVLVLRPAFFPPETQPETAFALYRQILLEDSKMKRALALGEVAKRQDLKHLSLGDLSGHEVYHFKLRFV